jgi:hypothetical protein
MSTEGANHKRTLTPSRARELAKRSAAVRRANAKAREKLTLEAVEAAFGPLETLEDGQRRLERIGVWACAGMLSGSVASSAARTVEIWVKAHEARLTRQAVEELSKKMEAWEPLIASLKHGAQRRPKPGPSLN